MKKNGSQDELGLRLSRHALRVLKERGIFAHSRVSLEHQHLAKRYVVRGLRSGGAVGDLGRYASFAQPDGRQIEWLHPVEAIGVNGLHGVVVAPLLVRVEMYEDGSPCEIFITMAKQGSTTSGLMGAFATVVSLALQHGVPLRVICQKLSHMRFEPSGWTGNPTIGYAKSLMDYFARWLDLKFLSGDQGELFNPLPLPTLPITDDSGTDPVEALGELIQMGDAPGCNICGSLMVRSGTCYRCMTCGSTSGCS